MYVYVNFIKGASANNQLFLKKHIDRNSVQIVIIRTP